MLKIDVWRAGSQVFVVRPNTDICNSEPTNLCIKDVIEINFFGQIFNFIMKKCLIDTIKQARFLIFVTQFGFRAPIQVSG